jgi:hypothetical protein
MSSARVLPPAAGRPYTHTVHHLEPRH